MEKLLIFPYNGNGLEAVDCLSNRFDFIGFVDDAKEKQGYQGNGFRIYSREAFEKYPEAKVLAVPGNFSNFMSRERIIRDLKLNDNRFATIVHPGASVSSIASIGYNVLVMAGVTVAGNSVLGNHICILPNSVIHHSCIIEDYCLIGANVTLASHVKVQKNSCIGGGSSVIDNIEIGERSLVGFGSNLTRNVPKHSIAVGNPAHIIGDTK